MRALPSALLVAIFTGINTVTGLTSVLDLHVTVTVIFKNTSNMHHVSIWHHVDSFFAAIIFVSSSNPEPLGTAFGRLVVLSGCR